MCVCVCLRVCVRKMAFIRHLVENQKAPREACVCATGERTFLSPSWGKKIPYFPHLGVLLPLLRRTSTVIGWIRVGCVLFA